MVNHPKRIKQFMN